MRKPRAPREVPPPLELDCLRALWRLGEANVRDVRVALEPARTLAYTTVMTVLERLVRKGAAARHKDGRSFRYAPLVTREALRRAAVRDLLEALFDGDQRQLIAYLEDYRPAADAAVPSDAAEPALDTTLL